MDIIQLQDPSRVVGLIAPFLASEKPFSEMATGVVIGGLIGQVLRGHHLIAVSEQTPVGYLGWGLSSYDVGRQWAEGKRSPSVPEIQSGPTVLLFTVWASMPIALARLRRQLSYLYPGQTLFGRRVKSANSGRPIELKLLRPTEVKSRSQTATDDQGDRFVFG